MGSTDSIWTQRNDAKGPFSSLSRILKQKVDETFPADFGKVTSLGPIFFALVSGSLSFTRLRRIKLTPRYLVEP